MLQNSALDSRMAHNRDEFGLTPRQRAFCKLYARTSNGRESAMKVGIAKTCAAGWACTLRKREGVQQAIAHFRERMETDVEIDLQGQINKLEQHRLAALKAKSFSAANSAVTEQNKILGLHYKRPDPIKAEEIHENDVDMAKLSIEQVTLLAAPDDDDDEVDSG